jgi:hypothetical protein
MTASLTRRLLIPAIIASFALAAGCSTTCPCPSRQAATTRGAAGECKRLAPPPATQPEATQPATPPPAAQPEGGGAP